MELPYLPHSVKVKKDNNSILLILPRFSLSPSGGIIIISFVCLLLLPIWLGFERLNYLLNQGAFKWMAIISVILVLICGITIIFFGFISLLNIGNYDKNLYISDYPVTIIKPVAEAAAFIINKKSQDQVKVKKVKSHL